MNAARLDTTGGRELLVDEDVADRTGRKAS